MKRTIISVLILSCICVGVLSLNHDRNKKNTVEILRNEAYTMLRARTYDATWQLVDEEFHNNTYVAYMQSTYENQENKRLRVELQIVEKKKGERPVYKVNITPWN